MTRFRSGSLALIPLSVLTLSAGLSGRPGAPAAELASPVQWYGPRSEIREQRLVQIADQEAWSRLWSEHRGDAAERYIAHGSGVAAPKIDFETYLAVAMFRGDTTNCDGEMLVSLEEREDDVLLRFDSFTFQTFSSEGRDDGAAARSYGIWLVPRTGKPITVEENTQRLLNQPPIWTQRATLEAP